MKARIREGGWEIGQPGFIVSTVKSWIHELITTVYTALSHIPLVAFIDLWLAWNTEQTRFTKREEKNKNISQQMTQKESNLFCLPRKTPSRTIKLFLFLQRFKTFLQLTWCKPLCSLWFQYPQDRQKPRCCEKVIAH